MSHRRKVVLDEESAGKKSLCAAQRYQPKDIPKLFLCICIVTNHVPWDRE